MRFSLTHTSTRCMHSYFCGISERTALSAAQESVKHVFEEHLLYGDLKTFGDSSPQVKQLTWREVLQPKLRRYTRLLKYGCRQIRESYQVLGLMRFVDLNYPLVYSRCQHLQRRRSMHNTTPHPVPPWERAVDSTSLLTSSTPDLNSLRDCLSRSVKFFSQEVVVSLRYMNISVTLWSVLCSLAVHFCDCGTRHGKMHNIVLMPIYGLMCEWKERWWQHWYGRLRSKSRTDYVHSKPEVKPP